jgi:predicted permease
MGWLRKAWNTLHSRSLQDDLDEELRLHLDLRTQELERSGMSREEARVNASRQFGNPALHTESMRKIDIAFWLETLFNDLRYALRQFGRNPVFTAMAVLSLGLGVGANVAIFSVMNAMLLKSLPVREPQQLVSLTYPDSGYVWTGTDDGERQVISYPEYLQLREHLTTLSGLCVAQSYLSRWQVRISGAQQESVDGRLVSEDYFSVLGIDSAAGRVFSPDDGTGPGQDPYAVISYDFWQRRFGGRPDVLGTRIKLDQATLSVIGVAEKGFRGETEGQNPDVWIPILMQPWVEPGHDWLHEYPGRSTEKRIWLHAFGRLKPGASLSRLQSEASVVFKGMMEAFYPSTLPPAAKREALSQYLVVRSARTGALDGRDGYSHQLTILMALAGLVLLIACANVANLLLARATARRREVGIRLSIGASRLRLFRQFLSESLLLSLFGGVVGVLIASSGARLLLRLLSHPEETLDLATGLDWRVFGFTLGMTLITAILFGLAPSLQASRTNINLSVRESHSLAHTNRRFSLAKVLVVGQVGLSLLLIVGAGLFLRTLWRLQTVPLGYPKEHLLQVRVDGLTVGYTDQKLASFYHDVADRIRALPGIRSVAYSELGLINGGESKTDVQAEGFTAQRDEDLEVRFDLVSPGYFSVVGIPVLLGRELGPEDTAASTRVCVINEELARHFFSGRNPIGRHLTTSYGTYRATMEIVGVVKNARSRSVREEIRPRFYLAVNQGSEGQIPALVTFLMRTVDEPKSMAAAVTKAILSVNPDVPIDSPESMEDLIENDTVLTHLIAQLCLIFGGLALLLVATGLYGLLSYGVARRTKEIGIRMAIGAGRGSVVEMILRETAVLLVLGLVIGLGGALATTRLVESQLYGLSRFDPVSFVSAAALLSAVAFIASYIPATRASRVDPVKALRHD